MPLHTILLIDDDDTTNLLNKYFTETIDPSIDVITTTNGKEGLQFLKNTDIAIIAPCLVILDVMMPIMDGWEFLEEFQYHFGNSLQNKVTISLLTGLDSVKVKQRALTTPLINHILEKPLSEEKLRTFIKKEYARKLSE